jgi:hypothetical protein
MKDNNKNRKLKFIRNKNRLRFGITKFYCTRRVTQEVFNDNFDFEQLVITAKKSLLKEYKLSLPKITIDSGHNGDDFIKNYITVRVQLHR